LLPPSGSGEDEKKRLDTIYNLLRKGEELGWNGVTDKEGIQPQLDLRSNFLEIKNQGRLNSSCT